VALYRPSATSEIAPLVSDVDAVITIGYGVLLPAALLSIPRYGFLNLHFSILPRWRGAAPVQRAIEAQDPVSGVTVFKLDAGMDTGPIYTVHRFALDSDITSDELLNELSLLGVDAVLETLTAIESGVKPVPQSDIGATRAFKLSREEGKIDWAQDALAISAKIRAFTSNPGAWTEFRGAQLKISSPMITDVVMNVGEITLQGKRLLIGSASTALEIGSVSAPGKQPMTGVAWANGARLHPGELCE
jgi:methionyl-tRNA formyltransferase